MALLALALVVTLAAAKQASLEIDSSDRGPYADWFVKKNMSKEKGHRHIYEKMLKARTTSAPPSPPRSAAMVSLRSVSKKSTSQLLNEVNRCGSQHGAASAQGKFAGHIRRWEDLCHLPGKRCQCTVEMLQRIERSIEHALYDEARGGGMVNETTLMTRLCAMPQQLTFARHAFPLGFNAVFDEANKTAKGELLSVWDAVGIKQSPDQVQQVLDIADLDKSGALSRDEAVEFLHTCVVVGSALPSVRPPEGSWEPTDLARWSGALPGTIKMANMRRIYAAVSLDDETSSEGGAEDLSETPQA